MPIKKHSKKTKSMPFRIPVHLYDDYQRIKKACAELGWEYSPNEELQALLRKLLKSAEEEIEAEKATRSGNGKGCTPNV